MHWDAADDRAEAWQVSWRKAGEPLSNTWHNAHPPWPETHLHTVARLENATLYYFRVRGILTTAGANPGDANWVAAEGAPSAEVAGTPTDTIIRTAPGNLRACAGYGEVTLTWDRVPKATSYDYT